ncbi:hypothetical protein [Nannocystis exedens]|uniref:hypothetical protein n=1 Tax=Nannocystis exedens TaxID=54 RepID=UPI001160B66C|nr:hypothetical protein [Nannocystis exedens]
MVPQIAAHERAREALSPADVVAGGRAPRARLRGAGSTGLSRTRLDIVGAYGHDGRFCARVPGARAPLRRADLRDRVARTSSSRDVSWDT